MGAKKTGLNKTCPVCYTDFYIIKSRISKTANHCCSIICSSKRTAKQRSDKLRKKEYPFISGKCKNCKGDIIIKNSSFDKPNRQFCSVSCKVSVNNSIRIWKQSSRDKIRNAQKGRKIPIELRLKYSEMRKGDKASNWQGGITNKNALIRNSLKMKIWRSAVFERDGYMCIFGGKEHGNKLHADHIKPFALFPELRFDINNGRTLCIECHKKTDSYGGKFRIYKKQLFESRPGIPY